MHTLEAARLFPARALDGDTNVARVVAGRARTRRARERRGRPRAMFARAIAGATPARVSAMGTSARVDAQTKNRHGAIVGRDDARARDGWRGRTAVAAAMRNDFGEGDVIEGERSDSRSKSMFSKSSSSMAEPLARLNALGDAFAGAVFGMPKSEINKSGDADGVGATGVSVQKIEMGARGGDLMSQDVETVQLIRCKFQIRKQITFGEELRLVGSHAGMGAWDLNKSLTLNWGEGDVWTTDDVELPVDGVFIYKYAVVPAGTPEQVLEWQEGNNQVLTLSSEDHPRLWIKDSWIGDPNQSGVYREKGESESKDARLINRVKKADERAKMAETQVRELKTDLKMAKAQVNALREEARLSANVRIALKEQIKAEQRRGDLLTDQVDAWKTKFMQISDGEVGDDVLPTDNTSTDKKKKTR